MGIWNSIFGKLKKEERHVEKSMPDNFRELTIRGIELIGRGSKKMENEEMYEYLISKGFPEHEASELIIFLPPAFCRKMLPELNWPPYYFDFYSQKKIIRREYRDNPRYLIIEEATEAYWNDNPNNDFILNIAGRSAEYNVINQLLNDGGKLEDLKLTESYVVR